MSAEMTPHVMLDPIVGALRASNVVRSCAGSDKGVQNGNVELRNHNVEPV